MGGGSGAGGGGGGGGTILQFQEVGGQRHNRHGRPQPSIPSCLLVGGDRGITAVAWEDDSGVPDAQSSEPV